MLREAGAYCASLVPSHFYKPATIQCKKQKERKPQRAIDEKDVVHPPGVEPGPIAWKAIILPLDQECLMKEWVLYDSISCVEIPFLSR